MNDKDVQQAQKQAQAVRKGELQKKTLEFLKDAAIGAVIGSALYGPTLILR